MNTLAEKGWARFPSDARSLAWARAARRVADQAIARPENAHWLQCDGTWFVGVNLLDTSPSGAVGDVALAGPAPDAIRKMGHWPDAWDRAQVSVLYPGYPRPRAGESAGGFAYRRDKDAAHVDGLLPVGPERRRMAQEFHGFILGLPLSETSPDAGPLSVWEGSHTLIAKAFRTALGPLGPDRWPETDVTAVYHAARREAFETCRRVTIHAHPGEAYLVHRFALHGMAPWADGAMAGPEGRMIAYFRPEISPRDWLDRE